MKRFIFLSRLRAHLESRQTARCAAARLRSMLAGDRALLHSDTARKLSAELREVLVRYFTVADFSFRMEADADADCMRYTMEAELVRM